MFFMKIDYPQVDLPLEMLAWTDVTEDILNVYKQSCKLRACIMAVCTEGTMKASINLLDYEIHPNNVVTLLPGTIIQFKEKTERVRLCFAGFSAACVARINLIQTIGSVYSKMIGQPIISLPPGSTLTYLKEYIALLSRMSCDGSFTLPPELADLSLQTILTSIKLIYRGIPEQESSSNRKKEIYMQLIQSIIEHYKTERRAQFYADELGISLQYLSTTVRQFTGKSILDTIAYVIITDAKAKLKGTGMTIQEIAYSLNFPSASFFGKYFKRYVGMTPLEFRNR